MQLLLSLLSSPHSFSLPLASMPASPLIIPSCHQLSFAPKKKEAFFFKNGEEALEIALANNGFALVVRLGLESVNAVISVFILSLITNWSFL